MKGNRLLLGDFDFLPSFNNIFIVRVDCILQGLLSFVDGNHPGDEFICIFDREVSALAAMEGHAGEMTR